MQEFPGRELDSKNDGCGVGGPTADLAGIVSTEPGGFRLKGKGGAKRMGKFWPVELERDDVFGREGKGAAPASVATTFSAERAVAAGNRFVRATTEDGAGDEPG